MAQVWGQRIAGAGQLIELNSSVHTPKLPQCTHAWSTLRPFTSRMGDLLTAGDWTSDSMDYGPVFLSPLAFRVFGRLQVTDLSTGVQICPQLLGRHDMTHVR